MKHKSERLLEALVSSSLWESGAVCEQLIVCFKIAKAKAVKNKRFFRFEIRDSSSHEPTLLPRSEARSMYALLGNDQTFHRLQRESAIVFPNFSQQVDAVSSFSHLHRTTTLQKSFSLVCNRSTSIDIHGLHVEWNHTKICSPTAWTKFSSMGNFVDEDFKMIRPRHLSLDTTPFPGQHWYEDNRSVDYLSIPEDCCLFSTNGWITSTGALFNCESQFPLLMKQGRQDLDLTIKAGELPRTTLHYTILYYTTLYYAILYYTILY